MSHVVCTAHDDGYRALADVTRPSLERYCTRWNYSLVYDPHIDEREKDACKARIFLQLFNSGAFSHEDLFLWVDTDALIMNSGISLDALAKTVRLGGGVHFAWAYDWNGPNSGVWAARFTSHAAHFVQVYDWRARAMGWGDNESMNQTMLLPPFRDFVRCVPGRHMNANLYDLHGLGHMAHGEGVNAYRDGDFILHLAGVEATTRLAVLKQYAKEAI